MCFDPNKWNRSTSTACQCMGKMKWKWRFIFVFLCTSTLLNELIASRKDLPDVSYFMNVSLIYPYLWVLKYLHGRTILVAVSVIRWRDMYLRHFDESLRLPVERRNCVRARSMSSSHVKEGLHDTVRFRATSGQGRGSLCITMYLYPSVLYRPSLVDYRNIDNGLDKYRNGLLPLRAIFLDVRTGCCPRGKYSLTSQRAIFLEGNML